MLRPGADSRSAAWVKTHVAADEPVDLRALAAAVEPDAGRHPAMIQAARAAAARAYEHAEAGRCRLCFMGEPDYPARLAEIADPPIVLWVRGTALLDGNAVAIVGSRAATPDGQHIARELADALARRGYVVVSGMAAGIDGAAHAAAVQAGGVSIGVLGCGVDVVYPARHKALAAAMVEHGVLVSELPLGTGPRPYHFPLRNRVISGLSRGVVLIEAGKGSGSLITARTASEQGRDVMAVPGNVRTGRSKGCHALIRDGARLIETIDDVLEELEGLQPSSGSGESPRPLPLSRLEATMAVSAPYSLDDLAQLTGWSGTDLLVELAQLEIEGRVVRDAGGRFVRG